MLPTKKDYRSPGPEKLSDPQIAEAYLNSALKDSQPTFLRALMNVTQAQESVAGVAKKSGVKRETIYRAFAKNGNPTLGTLNAVLETLGLRIQVVAERKRIPASSAVKPAHSKAKKPGVLRRRA
jgi:probable addiction module antidote protein